MVYHLLNTNAIFCGLISRNVAANANPDIAAAHRLFTNAKIVVPLKYLSNFFKILGMPLINCKIHLELNWTKNFVMSSIAGATTFKITSTKLYVPIVTLSTKDKANLTKQLSYKNFQKSYKKAISENLTRFPLDASFQGTNKLFVLAFNNTTENDNEVPASNTVIEFKETIIENIFSQE